MIAPSLRLFLCTSWLLVAGAFTGPTGWIAPQRTANGQESSHRRSAVTDTTESSDSETTSATLSLFSPCKINLFLRIIRKREDGFHDLASLFQAVGFGDTLELTPLSQETAKADEFTCNMPGVPVDSSNLVLRALELMRVKTGVSQYFRANLVKQVPAQAGLGGGSANAATAMWGANQLMGEPASVEEVRCLLGLVNIT
jgi:4-diphosphocytidyl-2-C-methyl-D-erythritol kinase